MGLKFRRVRLATSATCALSAVCFVIVATGCAAKGTSDAEEGGSDAAGTTPQDGSTVGPGHEGGGTGSDANGGGGDGQTQTGLDSGTTGTVASGGDAGSGPESRSGGCTGLPICDDFEEDTPGMKPANWTLVLGCNASQMQDTGSDGGLLVGVDTSEHHSGSHSVRVTGGDSCGYYFVNTSAFATLGSQVYARFWVMFSGAPTTGHNGFVSMYSGPAKTTAALDYNNTGQLRLGFQGGVVVWNSTIAGADSTLPDIDSTGEAESVVTPASQWSCIEFHIDQTNAHIEFRFQSPTASTEASVAGLSYDGTPTAGVSDTWGSSGPAAPLDVQAFGLGWLGLNDHYTVWFDDVALSGTTWIGCD